MPTIAILSIIVILGTLLLMLPTFIMNDRKRKEKLFSQLSREGSANDLVFCSQEILPDGVIGFDGIHRKILLIQKTGKTYRPRMICLDDVQSCELAVPSAQKRGECNTLNVPKEEVEILFHYKNCDQQISLKFYDSSVNSKREFEFFKAKAAYWSTIFSKILTPQIMLRA